MFNLPIRPLLALDAATCAAMALLLLLGAGPLSALALIPADLLFYAGLVLVLVSVFMATISSRAHPAGWAVKTIIFGNVAWVIASLALPVLGAFTPNALGWIFLVGQSAGVAVLTWLELRAGSKMESYA
jgi:hypothetical protein